MDSRSFSPTARLRVLSRVYPLVCMVLAATLVAGLVGGCKLIYPPAEDAIERALDAIACNDGSTHDELMDDEELRGEMRSLCKAFGSPAYRGVKDYWVIEEIEVDEAEGRTYVYVTIEVPFPKRSKFIEIVFNMERKFLDWKILDVEGLDQLMRAVEKLRAQVF